MSKARCLLVLAAATLIIAAFFVWPRGPQEPAFQGKPLTQWIDEAHDVGIFAQTEETDAAMQAMGTNAVPFLLKEFTRPISGWRRGLCAWVNCQPFFKLHFRTDEERVRRAGRGLMLLETNAAPALPVLARYLDDPLRDDFVIDIMAYQGKRALPYLTAGLCSTNAVIRTNALRTLDLLSHRSGASQ